MTTIKLGSRGAEVKTLQTLLGGLAADGIFGLKTYNAVISFQRSKGLKTDGIVGRQTWAALGIQPDHAVEIPCEDLKQAASPHGSKPYGPDKTWSTYANGGCGPTSLAVVHRAYGLVPKGETATETIQRLGNYAYAHKYRIKGNGTTDALLSTNGTTARKTSKASDIESALRNGRLVILLIKNGFPNGYGGKGHYIVAYGIKDDEVLLRDVGSSKASRQHAPLNKITTGLKKAYIMEDD